MYARDTRAVYLDAYFAAFRLERSKRRRIAREAARKFITAKITEVRVAICPADERGEDLNADSRHGVRCVRGAR